MCDKLEKFGKKLADGKTKRIFQHPTHPNLVYIQSKDSVTAGDGARCVEIPGKGALANQATCNNFQFLSTIGLPSHFVRKVDDITFLAQKLQMIPIEVVARRIAFGSYLKRHLNQREEEIFTELIRELFLKDDANHDPMMIWSEEDQTFRLYNAKLPQAVGMIGLVKKGDLAKLTGKYRSGQHLQIDMFHRMGQVFTTLEKKMAAHNVTLVDLKIEFGFTSTGTLTIGDVIDAESWRAWVNGDPKRALDKQGFRDAIEVNTDVVQATLLKYQTAAELTAKFLE